MARSDLQGTGRFAAARVVDLLCDRYVTPCGQDSQASRVERAERVWHCGQA